MKKLRLDTLKVESFATTAPAAAPRGTVAGQEKSTDCPYSWNGTCYVSCAECPSVYDPCS